MDVEDALHDAHRIPVAPPRQRHAMEDENFPFGDDLQYSTIAQCGDSGRDAEAIQRSFNLDGIARDFSLICLFCTFKN